MDFLFSQNLIHSSFIHPNHSLIHSIIHSFTVETTPAGARHKDHRDPQQEETIKTTTSATAAAAAITTTTITAHISTTALPVTPAPLAGTAATDQNHRQASKPLKMAKAKRYKLASQTAPIFKPGMRTRCILVPLPPLPLPPKCISLVAIPSTNVEAAVPPDRFRIPGANE